MKTHLHRFAFIVFLVFMTGIINDLYAGMGDDSGDHSTPRIKITSKVLFDNELLTLPESLRNSLNEDALSGWESVFKRKNGSYQRLEKEDIPLLKSLFDEKVDFDALKQELNESPSLYLNTYCCGTIVENAIRSSNLNILKLLFESGADINVPIDNTDNVVSYFARAKEKEKKDFAAYLISLGAEYQDLTPDGYFIHSYFADGSIGRYDYNSVVPYSALDKYKGSLRMEAVIRSFLYNSFLVWDEDYYAYHPSRAFDGNFETGWIDGEKRNPGIGTSIGLTLDRKITVDELKIAPGYFDKRWFKDNNRVKRLKIRLNDQIIEAAFKDEMKLQSIKLEKPVSFNYALFTIMDVYPSKSSDDTAISEIQFYIKGQRIKLHTGKVAQFLRHVHQDVVIREVRDEVLAIMQMQGSGFGQTSNIKIPIKKLTAPYFNTILEYLNLPGNGVTWIDKNGNGIAEIEELVSFKKEWLSAVLAFAGRTQTDDGLSLYDYYAECIRLIAQNKKKDLGLLLQNEVDYGYDEYQFIPDNILQISSFLGAAAFAGNIDILEKCKKAGVDINEKPENGFPAIFIAIDGKQKDAIAWLIKNGANVNSEIKIFGENNRLNRYFTPLIRAAQVRNLDIVQLLVANGGDIDVKNEAGETLLFIAASGFSPELVEYFYSKGLDINAKSSYGDNAILGLPVFDSTPVRKEEGENVFLSLLEKKAEYSRLNSRKQSVLSMAAAAGWEKAVEVLIVQNNMNADGLGEEVTPLNLAIKNHYGQIAALLIKYGADLERPDQRGYPPLCNAVEARDVNVTKLLIKSGANVRYSNRTLAGVMDIIHDLLFWDTDQCMHMEKIDKDPRVKELASILFQAGAIPTKSTPLSPIEVPNQK
jgi:ankyrin repeat protein